MPTYKMNECKLFLRDEAGVTHEYALTGSPAISSFISPNVTVREERHFTKLAEELEEEKVRLEGSESPLGPVLKRIALRMEAAIERDFMQFMAHGRLPDYAAFAPRFFDEDASSRRFPAGGRREARLHPTKGWRGAGTGGKRGRNGRRRR